MPFQYLRHYLKAPATQELADGESWVIEEGFWWTNKDKTIFVPPSGMGDISNWIDNPVWTTDYGSIPKVFQNLLSPTRFPAPYILHDWLYTAELFDRSTCDWILLEALQESGANWLVRNTIYSAVRAGGWAVWRKHDPKKVAALKDYLKRFQAAT